MKKISLLVGLVLASQVNANEISPYIVNGTQVSDSDLFDTYPTFASLYYHDGSQFGNYCGATLIDSLHVLTAAHCIYEYYSDMLHTWIVPRMSDQTAYASGAYMSARVEKVFWPSSYSPNLDPNNGLLLPDDIAILKLDTALNVSDYRSNINSTVDNVYALNRGSDTFKVIGRGYTNHVVDNLGNTLSRTSTDVVLQTSLTSSNACSPLTSSQLCFDGNLSGSYKNSTCNGDSGGPVYWWDGSGYKQIGITSYGPGTCGDPSVNYTSVFTEVYDYTAWINSVLNGSEQPKYYIEKLSTQRQLREQSTGNIVAVSDVHLNDTFMPSINSSSGSTSTTPATDGGGGGSFGLAFLSLLGFAGWVRRK